tara:strand:+ start:1324 stop:1446 length:123 start_codon:yes stop_codon:yes gene_type:complete
MVLRLKGKKVLYTAYTHSAHLDVGAKLAQKADILSVDDEP